MCRPTATVVSSTGPSRARLIGMIHAPLGALLGAAFSRLGAPT